MPGLGITFVPNRELYRNIVLVFAATGEFHCSLEYVPFFVHLAWFRSDETQRVRVRPVTRYCIKFLRYQM